MSDPIPDSGDEMVNKDKIPVLGELTFKWGERDYKHIKDVTERQDKYLKKKKSMLRGEMMEEAI